MFTEPRRPEQRCFVWVSKRQKFCFICILSSIRKLWIWTFPHLIKKTVGTQHEYVLSCASHFTCEMFFRLCGRLTPPQCSHWMSEFQRILKRPLEICCKNRWCASICINLTRVPRLYTVFPQSSDCMYTSWVSKRIVDLKWPLTTSVRA